MQKKKEESLNAIRPSPALAFAVKRNKKPKQLDRPEPASKSVEVVDESTSVAAQEVLNQNRTAKPRKRPKVEKPVYERFHTELRGDYKRRLADICYVRKRDGLEPNTIIEITEEAFALWFEGN